MNITDNKQTVINEMNTALKNTSDMFRHFSVNIPFVAASEKRVYKRLMTELKEELFVELKKARQIRKKYPRWEMFKMMFSHTLNILFSLLMLTGVLTRAIKNKVKMWLLKLNLKRR